MYNRTGSKRVSLPRAQGKNHQLEFNANPSDTVVLVEVHNPTNNFNKNGDQSLPFKLGQEMRTKSQQREREKQAQLRQFQQTTMERLQRYHHSQRPRKTKSPPSPTHRSQPSTTPRQSRNPVHVSDPQAPPPPSRTQVSQASARLSLLRFSNRREYAEEMLSQQQHHARCSLGRDTGATWRPGAPDDCFFKSTTDYDRAQHQQQIRRAKRQHEMMVERFMVKHAQYHKRYAKQLSKREQELIQARKDSEQPAPQPSEHMMAELYQSKRQDEQDRAALKKRRSKQESIRYAAALQQRLRHKIKSKQVEMPVLCSCDIARQQNLAHVNGHAPVVLGPSWERCANNCVFYNNPQRYARALGDIFRSLDVIDMAK